MSIYLTKQMPNPDSVRDAANDDVVEIDKNWFRRWLETAVRRWQRRRMMQALEQLDDRMLADIGMHRGDIPCVVKRLDDRELRMVPVAESACASKTPSGFQKAA